MRINFSTFHGQLFLLKTEVLQFERNWTRTCFFVIRPVSSAEGLGVLKNKCETPKNTPITKMTIKVEMISHIRFLGTK